MYEVLIVDDETIILSGIKFLIDWGKNDCVITGTARNGRDALEKIQSCPPDIVLCDINMPVIDGMELLSICNEAFPSVVFIMLTNLEEFSLARDAIRCRAVDYLLKVQLEASSLEESLKKARQEVDRRRKLLQAERTENASPENIRQRAGAACQEALFSPDPQARAQAEEELKQLHVLEHFGLFYIPFSWEAPFSCTDSDAGAGLIAWERELAARLADNIFGDCYQFIDLGQSDFLTLMIWNREEGWEQRALLFASKLTSASRNITQAVPTTLYTPCFCGAEQFSACRDSYFNLVESYYLDAAASPAELPKRRPSFEPLGLAGIGSQLEVEINVKNITGCSALLDRAAARIRETTHQKSQAIWLCNELCRASARALKDTVFSDACGYREIEHLMTRQQVLHWIEKLKNSLVEVLWQDSNTRSEPVERARQYILDHIEDRLLLQDVANEVCISAGYLSTLFKRQYHQSLVSFINQAKVEYACRLIQERKYRISEISFRLSFENAYYFARVFKKYMGMTPTEYEKSLHPPKAEGEKPPLP